MRRRDFLKLAGATAAYRFSSRGIASGAGPVSVVLEEGGPATHWAAEQLCQALADRGVSCALVPTVERAAGSSFCIVAAAQGSAIGRDFRGADAEMTGAESLRMVPGRLSDTQAVLVSANGERGFVYGLLELTERVRFRVATSRAWNCAR